MSIADVEMGARHGVPRERDGGCSFLLCKIMAFYIKVIFAKSYLEKWVFIANRIVTMI
ncbi:MAG: hypothetical protein ACI39W_08820 [Brotaphodocola sp.]